jgi:acetyl-CoA acetyltransferase family protein
VIDAVRTPIGRRDGWFSDRHAADLLAHALRALTERTGVDPASVDDVICGCVTQIGEQSMNIGRNGWLAAGLPESVPATTVDRQCGSSQQAIHFAAQGVMAGAYDLVVACGVEHMTRVPMGSNMDAGGPYSETMRARYRNGLVPQGISAELVAARWNLTRDDLDAFAARSHERAGAATRAGAFAAEILPVEGSQGVLERDEGIRIPNLEKMGALPPAFREDGIVTAGNSSQISDGAAAVLIASSRAVAKLEAQPRARFVSFSVVGDDPVLMLTAPIPATRSVLNKAGLDLEDIDAVEINEAFASVPLAWQQALGISDEWFEDHVNINGGAIALGHPLGASGARLLTTLLNTLERTNDRYGLQTMCEGGGLANATIIERV